MLSVFADLFELVVRSPFSVKVVVCRHFVVVVVVILIEDCSEVMFNFFLKWKKTYGKKCVACCIVIYLMVFYFFYTHTPSRVISSGSVSLTASKSYCSIFCINCCLCVSSI